MKHRLAALRSLLKLASLGLLVAVAGGCTRHTWQDAFTLKVMQVSYDDLGPEAMVEPTLGPRGRDLVVTVHHGATDDAARPRLLNVHQGLLLLRKNYRCLPQTPENDSLRQRMARAYSRLYQHYRTRRDAMMATPPSFGRGSMGRMMLMPPMPPTI
jgi:hypothetical protein